MSLPATIGNVKTRTVHSPSSCSWRWAQSGGIQCCFWDSRRRHFHWREQAKFELASSWPGHQFPAEPFSFWLKAPAKRPIRRGGGGDRRSLRYKPQPSYFRALSSFPGTPLLFFLEIKITGACQLAETCQPARLWDQWQCRASWVTVVMAYWNEKSVSGGGSRCVPCVSRPLG